MGTQVLEISQPLGPGTKIEKLDKVFQNHELLSLIQSEASKERIAIRILDEKKAAHCDYMMKDSRCLHIYCSRQTVKKTGW